MLRLSSSHRQSFFITGKRSIKRLTAVLLSALLLLTGCAASPLPAYETEIQSGAPTVTEENQTLRCTLSKSDALTLHFTAEASPLTYYTVQANAGLQDKCHAALAGSETDLNGLSIQADPDENGQMARIVRSNETGQLHFRIVLDGAGTAELSDIQVKEAEDCRLFTSSSGNVRILLCSADITEAGITDAQLTAWLDALDEIRGIAAAWSADGLESLDICAACTFQHYGLSGDPIYISRSTVTEGLRRVAATIDKPKEERDILWEYVHEICHAADGFGHGTVSEGIFDSEFSAQLECACVMTCAGYQFRGEKDARTFFEGSIPLSNRIFSDEGFLYRLLQIFDENGTDLSEVIPVFSLQRNAAEETAAEKLEVFFHLISDCVGYSVEAQFTEQELNLIRNKYALDN